MDRQCVICDSKAIVTQEAAKGIALMISFSDSTWSKMQEAKDRAIREGRDLLVICLAAVAQNYAAAANAAGDVAKHHFGGFYCLCLRCGARFDDAAMYKTSGNPALLGDS
jgi:hypothetical protein